MAEKYWDDKLGKPDGTYVTDFIVEYDEAGTVVLDGVKHYHFSLRACIAENGSAHWTLWDQIYVDAAQPVGYVVVESAHTGYKAKLWKVVTENGVEVSREQVNSSNYKMTPRSATVGVATGDPVAQAEIMAAIGTSSIDHVKNVIAILTAPPATEEAPQ